MIPEELLEAFNLWYSALTIPALCSENVNEVGLGRCIDPHLPLKCWCQKPVVKTIAWKVHLEFHSLHYVGGWVCVCVVMLA